MDQSSFFYLQDNYLIWLASAIHWCRNLPSILSSTTADLIFEHFMVVLTCRKKIRKGMLQNFLVVYKNLQPPPQFLFLGLQVHLNYTWGF